VPRGVPSGFVDIIIQLFKSPSSSAAIERVFSSFGLSSETDLEMPVSKLVFCYKMLQGKFDLEY